MKKRRILMGNPLSPTTHVHLTTGTIGGVYIDPSDPQRKEIIKLLNNIPVDNKYLLHRPTEMFSKIFHPVFLTQKGEILELKNNIAYETIDSLRLQVADNIYPLKPLQRQQINKLMKWFSSNTPEPTSPKFDPGYLRIDDNGYLYFFGEDESISYILRENPFHNLTNSHKSKKHKA